MRQIRMFLLVLMLMVCPNIVLASEAVINPEGLVTPIENLFNVNLGMQLDVAKGIIAKNPLKATELITATAKVAKETVIALGSAISAVKPAIEAATGANSNPITAAIAPIAAGGKRTLIQLVPTNLINSANKQKVKPKAINPDCAAA